MYGSWGLGSFIGLALVVLAVIALMVLASPLIAIVIALVIGIPMLFIAGARRRAGEPGRPGPRERPVKPEGRPTSPTGSRSRGEPASGGG
jgi:hypothetical protein